MSFLTPLYLAGLAALALPVMFHLIRRTPANRRAFSSTMFLAPSPPRLTRRSRIEHWLLLLLRAGALALLALAFARPFLADGSAMPLADSPHRRVAILMDTSASMLRDGLFEQAVSQAVEHLEELQPRDEVGLFSFDRHFTTHVGWGEHAPQAAEARRALVRQQLSQLQPSWQSTNLGAALVALADVLEATRESEGESSDMELEIVLVSDLQRGARLDELQNFAWPAVVRLSVERIEPAAVTNAAARLVERGVDGGELSAASDQRIRVTNAANSRESQFQLCWDGETPGSISAAPIGCYVPPGESRVVKLPVDPAGLAEAVRVSGDDQEFDNLHHVALPPQRQLLVQHIGGAEADERPGLHYFLERAFPESARRTVVVTGPATEVDPAAVLYVVSGPLTASAAEAIRERVRAGANTLCVMTGAGDIETVRRLSGDETFRGAEAEVPDYAILSHIDLKHPLLAPFADARFSDFTKIHFWKHRAVEGSHDAGWHELARFDSGDPALLAKRLERGEVFVLTSSWRPDESQLALSTKFVPLLGQMLEPRSVSRMSAYEVGQPIALDAFAEPVTSVQLPGGAEVVLNQGSDFAATDEPGIYTFVGANEVFRVAVNLSAGESNTDPLDVGDFEPYGVNVPAVADAERRVATERKLHDNELERRQSLWRWLIVGVLAFLLMETLWAGKMARAVRNNALGASAP